eukprot:403340982
METINNKIKGAAELSMKSMARRKIIKNGGKNLSESLRKVDLRQESDILIKDIITQDNSNDMQELNHFLIQDNQQNIQENSNQYQCKISGNESSNSIELQNESDQEYWEIDPKDEDFDEVQEGTSQLQSKHEAYLKLHSQNLSTHIQNYLNKIEKGQEIQINERISDLGLMAFERKQFIKSLHKLKKAFQIQFRQVQFMSKIKCKEVVEQMFETISQLFAGEVKEVVDQYSQMKKQSEQMQKDLKRMTQICKTQEEQIIFRDRHYEVIPCKFLDLFEDPSIFAPHNHQNPNNLSKFKLTEQDIADHNSILKEPLEFYSGYMQISMNSKDEIIESELTKLYYKEIKSYKEKLEFKDNEIQSLRQVLDVYISDQEKMNKELTILKDELRLKIKDAENEQARFQVKYRKIYNDYNKSMDKVRGEYREYRQFTEIELQVQDQCIQKLQNSLRSSADELQLVKIVLSIPRLRNSLNQFDLRNSTHSDIISQLHEIIRASKTGSRVTNILPNISPDIHELSSFGGMNSQMTHSKAFENYEAYIHQSSQVLKDQTIDNEDLTNKNQSMVMLGMSPFENSNTNIGRNNSSLDNTLNNSLKKINMFNTTNQVSSHKRSPSHNLINFTGADSVKLPKLIYQQQQHSLRKIGGDKYEIANKIDDHQTKMLLNKIQMSPNQMMLSTNYHSTIRNSSSIKKSDIGSPILIKNDYDKNMIQNQFQQKNIGSSRDFHITLNSSVNDGNGMNFTLGNFGFKESMTISSKDQQE